MSGAVPRAKLGLVLSGGAARGWAHIGILQALTAAGLRFDVVTGASIGAVAGAFYLAGKLDGLERDALEAKGLRLAGYADLQIRGAGLLGGQRILKRFRQHFGTMRVEDLPVPFASIGLDLVTGKERLLTRGPIAEVLRTSISLPGIFEPIVTEDAVLIDGGLIQPVPVNACRALGAERIIAVDLLGDYAGVAQARQLRPGAPIKSNPFQVLTTAFAVVMRELGQVRQAGAPADLTLVPPIGHIQTHEFHRAEELIALGRAAAERALDGIQAVADAASLQRRCTTSKA
ncbi:MAG: lysophospholipase [Geminicoccaceae bacterium]|nr:MAG: lysophospholipase [Geminicoccaceae bacterium]